MYVSIYIWMFRCVYVCVYQHMYSYISEFGCVSLRDGGIGYLKSSLSE